MPSTIVELAKILCPSPARLAKRVALALEDPAAYVSKYRADLELRGVEDPVDDLPVLACSTGSSRASSRRSWTGARTR